MPSSASILSLPADRPLLARLIFFLLGCLMTTAFAPVGWAYLVPALLLPIFYLCLTLSPRDAGRYGFWFGFGLFLSGTYWIYISVVVFGQAPAWIALMLMIGLVLLMSIYLWLTIWMICRFAAGEPWLLLLVAPSAWVLIEWARGWLLTGFPWMALGYSQIDTPLAGWAPVVGVYGVSWLLVFSSAALLVAVLADSWRRWLAAGLFVVPWISGGLLATTAWTQPVGSPITVTLIQGGISQDRKWLPEEFQPTLEHYRSRTRSARQSDVVVWPEVAIPSVDDRVENYIVALESDARWSGQTIFFGILERAEDRDGEATIHNSVFALDGERRQVYRKRHLVPFGEYFPVPDSVRSWMRMLNLPHSDLTPGDAVQPLISTRNGIEYAVAICYEDAYGAEQLYALPDADLLINVSNDAWFGDSIAPHQHLQIARMRSLEVGRAAIRATNTGISAFIGADGKLLDSGDQFRAVELTRSLQGMQGLTPYVARGNQPVVLLCSLILAVFWLRTRAS
jgi:apolipoprotein N-acyltransferase